jgi:hypothetical protein
LNGISLRVCTRSKVNPCPNIFLSKSNKLPKPDLGKLRLQKWYITLPSKEKAKIIKDLTTLVLARQGRMCNFLEYKGAYLVSRMSYHHPTYVGFCVMHWQGEKCVLRTYAPYNYRLNICDRSFIAAMPLCSLSARLMSSTTNLQPWRSFRDMWRYSIDILVKYVPACPDKIA